MRRSIKQKIFYYTHPKLYQMMISSLKKTEEKVIWILKHFPETRNSDNLLLFMYWDKCDGLDADNFLDEAVITKLTPSESITRCRRNIQNTYGMFLPTEESVLEEREIKQEAVRDWAIQEQKMSSHNIQKA